MHLRTESGFAYEQAERRLNLNLNPAGLVFNKKKEHHSGLEMGLLNMRFYMAKIFYFL